MGAAQDTGVVTDPEPLNVPRWRVQVDNLLGSSAIELDESAAVISYEEYHPYGSTAFHSATGAAETSRKRYRYTGKERDDETGLYYHGARYYAAWLGRWVSADPLGVEEPGTDDFNVYAYVGGQVLTFTDDTGSRKTPRTSGNASTAKIAQLEGKLLVQKVRVEQARIALQAAEQRLAVANARLQALKVQQARNAKLSVFGRVVAAFSALASSFATIQYAGSTTDFAREAARADLDALVAGRELTPAEADRIFEGVVEGISSDARSVVQKVREAKELIRRAREEEKKRKKKGSVSLDTNVLNAAIARGEEAELLAAVAGRKIFVSPEAAEEFLALQSHLPPNEARALRTRRIQQLALFLHRFNADVGVPSSEAHAEFLVAEARKLGRGLSIEDARVASSAIRSGSVLLTEDEQLFKTLNAISPGSAELFVRRSKQRAAASERSEK